MTSPAFRESLREGPQCMGVQAGGIRLSWAGSRATTERQ